MNQPRIFYPAQDGGHQRCPYLYPAQDFGRTQDQEKQQRGEDMVNEHGDAEKRSTTTTRPGLQHGGPRRAEPAEQGQSSGEKGHARATQREAEDQNNPRVANASGGEEQPDCAPFRPVPPTEKQVNTLASTPPATHIRTVPKPPSTNRTV